MISKFKNQLQPIIAIIAQPFLSWNPHLLTLMSVASALLFCILVAFHLYFWAFVACLGFVFDALDGYVARHSQRVTLFGGILDSTTDRVSDFFILSSFAYAGLVGWGLIAPLFVTAFLISYIRSRSETAFPGRHFAEGIMQRTERIIFLILALLLYVIFPNANLLIGLLVLLLILNCITIVQRLLLLPRN